jgi:hypothetical protein
MAMSSMAGDIGLKVVVRQRERAPDLIGKRKDLKTETAADPS